MPSFLLDMHHHILHCYFSSSTFLSPDRESSDNLVDSLLNCLFGVGDRWTPAG
jgi:hypothetical protein